MAAARRSDIDNWNFLMPLSVCVLVLLNSDAFRDIINIFTTKRGTSPPKGWVKGAFVILFNQVRFPATKGHE